MADPGVSLQIVTQLAVGQEALLAREVGALLAGLAPHREVRAPSTWGGDTPDLGASRGDRLQEALGCEAARQGVPVAGDQPCSAAHQPCCLGVQHQSPLLTSLQHGRDWELWGGFAWRLLPKTPTPPSTAAAIVLGVKGACPSAPAGAVS